MVRKIEDLGDYIVNSFSGSVRFAVNSVGELSLDVDCGDLVSLCSFLRDDPHCCFVNIIDLCGVDFLSRSNRFDVVYQDRKSVGYEKIIVVCESNLLFLKVNPIFLSWGYVLGRIG